MSLFPDLVKHSYEDVSFFLHVTGGFNLANGFWKKAGKRIRGDSLWVYADYKQRGKAHLARVKISKSERGCADVQIKLGPGSAKTTLSSVDKSRRMSEEDFLNFFRLIVQKGNPEAIAFGLKRTFPIKGPLFGASEDSEFRFRGFKLQARSNSPFYHINIEEVSPKSAMLIVSSKPLFSLDEEYINELFFTGVMTKLGEWSKLLFSKIVGAAHGPSFNVEISQRLP